MKRRTLILCMVAIAASVQAQVFTNKEVGKKNKDLADSIKRTEYPYILPIWGDKATKRGYNLPYSAGLSLQYFGQESSLIIENLRVGFNNGTMYNVDQIIRFDEARARASAVTVRPDFWILPFLNVYGILGTASASTKVGFGLWVPDATNTPQEVLSTQTTVEFKTTTFGLGVTPTLGVGGGFIALDMNFSWTDVPQLKSPAQAFVFGPRFGKNFRLKRPDQGIAVWAGGFRVKLNTLTEGSIPLSDVLPSDFGSKVDQGIARVGDVQQQVDAWWGSLTPAEQKNPVNAAKYETANSALARAGEILNAAQNAVTTVGNSTVQYAMDKRPKDMWNFIVGAQYQHNKHFMLRSEVGFLGSRNQVLIGVQYRFGL